MGSLAHHPAQRIAEKITILDKFSMFYLDKFLMFYLENAVERYKQHMNIADNINIFICTLCFKTARLAWNLTVPEAPKINLIFSRQYTCIVYVLTPYM